MNNKKPMLSTTLLKPASYLLTFLGALFIGLGLVSALDVTNKDVFTDITPGNDHYVAIQYLKENGLIQGYDDGSFKPLKEINRAEALKIITGALTKEKEPLRDIADFEFEDIDAESWYYTYVAEAWSNGIVDGYPDGKFHPENTINRAESLKMALIQDKADLPDQVTEKPYTDVPVDAWFAPYAQVSKERSLILRSRTDGGMYPGQNMNRGEFAELIYRVLKSREGNRFARTTWYGFENVNWGTASGEKFDTNLPTCAHQALPFGTKLLVTNMYNGKSVIVKVNDRGPVAPGMDLDLTSSAFESIASLGIGIIVAEYEIIDEEEIPSNSEPAYVDEYGF